MRTTLLPVLALALATALPLSAQSFCSPPVDDGFQVGCCVIPTVTLPNFPALTMTAEWGVLNNCVTSFQTQCTVAIGAPSFFECDYAIIPITITGLSTAPAVTTFVLAKYVRTWQEIANTGAAVNVWRFLINGDIPFVSTAGCPAGPCLPTAVGAPWLKPAHMVGHIDYTCDGIIPNPTWSAAISLSHLPGCFQHAFFSTCPIPALAAVNRSYHLVGPAPFVFAPIPEPQGVLRGDSLRASTLFVSPFFYFCHGETDFMTGGVLATAGANCFCAPMVNGRWRHQNLTAQALCSGFATTFQSVPVGGTPLAPTGFAALTLGNWTAGPNFPGNRSLVVYLGVVQNNFTCSPVLSPVQIVTGVGTTSSQPGQLFSIPGTPPVIVSTFIDLQNMLPLSLWTGGGIGTPRLGSLFAPHPVAGLDLP